jgi:hypothetical protein
MASTCPCGCGRKVGFSTKGAAAGVAAMDRMLSDVAPEVDAWLRAGTVGGDEADRMRSFVDDGRRIRGFFIDHVHRVARPGKTPDLLELKRRMDRWAATALKLAAAMPPGPSARPVTPPEPAPAAASPTPSGAGPRPAVGNEMLVGLSEQTAGRLTAGGGLFDPAGALATTDAVAYDDVLAAAGRLAYHLRHPGRPVTVAVAAAVEAALDDLGVAPGTADPEAEEWLGLAVLEGWRAGRRVLGTDVTPYPYEKVRAELPVDVIDAFRACFRRTNGAALVDAGRLSAPVEAVVDVLSRAERPGWFPPGSADARRQVYRTCVQLGVAVAVAEFETLRDDADEAAHAGQPAPAAGSPTTQMAGPRRLRSWENDEPDGPVDDLGPAVIDRLAADLQIDNEWSLRSERDLTWWAHRLAQHISVGTPRVALGEATVALRAQTDVVDNVGASDQEVRDILLALNRTAALGAFVWDPDGRRICQTTTAYLHAGNADVARVAALAVIVGNWEAHGRADALAALVGGRPAVSAHPLSGERPEADGMLRIGEEIRRHGQEPSRFVGPVLGALPGSPYIPWVASNGDNENLTGELAFTSSVSGSEAAAAGVAPGTALVQVATDVDHPAYGHGALMLMSLPLRLDDDEAAELACGLNRAEAFEWTGFPQFGAWSTSPTTPGTVTHATFLVNYAQPLGLFPLVAFYESLRCGWAAERLTTATAGRH